MAKPRIGIFSFTSCEGCSLAILECEDELLDVLAIVDIVNFREGMTEKEDDVDIAFVDGALSTKRDVEHMKHIREHSGLVVAIGACAHTGGQERGVDRRHSGTERVSGLSLFERGDCILKCRDGRTAVTRVHVTRSRRRENRVEVVHTS